MSKTITIRLDDPVYHMFKIAADGQHRTMSNFIEWATLAYLTTETFVSGE